MITARLNEIAAGAPATTPDEVAPEATSDTSDDLRNAAMVTFKEFQQGAQFVTNKGSKRLHVRFGPTVYWVREQKYGKLTAPVDEVLRFIHREAVTAKITTYTVLSTMRYFADEYNAHITDHHCPAGVCTLEKRPVSEWVHA